MRLIAYGDTKAFHELVERLSSRGEDVALVGAPEALGGEAGLRVALVAGRVPPAILALSQQLANRLVLFVERAIDATESDLLALKSTPLALVVKHGELSADELLVTVDKVLDPSPLGIERYLPGSAAPTRITLTQSTERGGAIATLQAFVSDLDLDVRRVSQILTVADEFITNAFYHAPVDGIGGHPFSHVSRMDLIETRPGHAIELTFGRNDERVAVSVRDTYGSLSGAQVRSRLAKAATSVTATFKVAPGASGAKLGLVTAARASSRLVFNLVPDELAECIGVIETAGTYRQFLEAGRSLDVFSLPRQRP